MVSIEIFEFRNTRSWTRGTDEELASGLAVVSTVVWREKKSHSERLVLGSGPTSVVRSCFKRVGRKRRDRRYSVTQNELGRFVFSIGTLVQ